MRTKLLLGVLLLTLACAPAFAAEAVNASPAQVTADLTINVNVVNALRLTLLTGTNTPACTITRTNGTTDDDATTYSMNFGDINGLGIDPGANCTDVTQVAGNYVWYTNYGIKTQYAGLPNTADVKLKIATDFTNNAMLKVRETSFASGATALTTNLTTTDTTIISAATNSATPKDRLLGIAMIAANVNGAGSTGADSVVLTYTLVAN
ncbi:MAG TPA: hypothetical protein VLA96_02310 [Terriglobales bacterium]|nr:hypothetical protein [Terriglobales bacterium]